MSESNPEFIRSSTQDRRKTQLSVYSSESASWLFLDPASITWTD